MDDVLFEKDLSILVANKKTLGQTKGKMMHLLTTKRQYRCCSQIIGEFTDLFSQPFIY